MLLRWHGHRHHYTCYSTAREIAPAEGTGHAPTTMHGAFVPVGGHGARSRLTRVCSPHLYGAPGTIAATMTVLPAHVRGAGHDHGHHACDPHACACMGHWARHQLVCMGSQHLRGVLGTAMATTHVGAPCTCLGHRARPPSSHLRSIHMYGALGTTSATTHVLPAPARGRQARP